MMSAGRSGSSGMRPRSGTKKRQESGPYIMLAVVAILVIVIVLVVALSGRKSGAQRVARQERTRSTEVATSERVSSTGRKTERKSPRVPKRERKKLETETQRRERRQRERLERRSPGRSTRRSSRGGYAVRKSGTPVLRAIISQPTGERVAVVGERQVKNGDQIDGRRIIEVGADRVKVEYFTKSYEVKLNQPLY